MALRRHGLARLLFDLLTEREERLDERAGELRFDIDLLGRRLELAITAVELDNVTSSMPIGLFDASTGAAAALVAAVWRSNAIAPVVSRGGRPDLASGSLVKVRAPTLLIVAGRDEVVLGLNQAAAAQMPCVHELIVVPGATHLFGEPGALDEVARPAGDWFTMHLSAQVHR